MSRGFLKPNIDDDVFKEDKIDIDAQKDTSFVYNPVQSWSLNAQRTRLPIAKNKDDILYLLEQNQGRYYCEDKSTKFKNLVLLKSPRGPYCLNWLMLVHKRKMTPKILTN